MGADPDPRHQLWEMVWLLKSQPQRDPTAPVLPCQPARLLHRDPNIPVGIPYSINTKSQTSSLPGSWISWKKTLVLILKTLFYFNYSFCFVYCLNFWALAKYLCKPKIPISHNCHILKTGNVKSANFSRSTCCGCVVTEDA